MRHGEHKSLPDADTHHAHNMNGQSLEDDLSQIADAESSDESASDGAHVVARHGRPRSGPGWQALGILAEILLTLAAICGLYIAWQMWWTGVQSEHDQRQQLQSSGWSNPSKGGQAKIARAQQGDPPVEPRQASEGELIAQIYIPRFGNQWQRNIVQGTDQVQLNKHGLGHYDDTQMPGELGNLAMAGHRNGYGQPLGDVDKLKQGDAIVIRTKDYWYVYRYTSDKIVLPNQVEVIASNPDQPGAQPTKRMVTLTTCEPKYSTPTHRWISYGEFAYWAKVSDGVPKELTTTGASGAVKFINNDQASPASRLDSLVPVMVVAALIYLVLFIAAAIAWRWPRLREIREGRRPRPDLSIYGALMRVQPGAAPIRFVLLMLLLVIAAAAIIQWGCPWAASTIPYLRSASNYVTV